MAVRFFINGREITESNADPEMTLLTYLRLHLRIGAAVGLTGTKLGCGEGGCGACTVMVSRYNHYNDTIEHYAVNSCLAPLCAMDGLAITTVEGIGNTKKLHPCQERLAKAHGSQCGFCTPGFVMSMYTLLRNNPRPTQKEMEDTFQGNLCRCTGYRPILDGYRTFCSDCPCRSTDVKTPKLFDETTFAPFDPTQDLIFPPKLKLVKPSSLEIKSDRVKWYRPVTLDELIILRNRYPQHDDPNLPQFTLVAGNTRIGVETRLKDQYYPVMICVSDVPELLEMSVTDDGVLVGASVTLTHLLNYFTQLMSSFPSHQTGVIKAVIDMLKKFAGHQIRNVSTLGGNIITASPMSDINPILLATGCVLNLLSVDGKHTVKVDASFFTDYRKTALSPNEVLVSVVFPFTNKKEHVMIFKQSRRRNNDSSIVNACMHVMINEDDMTVKSCNLAFGGMCKTTIMAHNTQTALKEKVWNKDLLEFGCGSLVEELVLPPTVPGGMPVYRLSLCLSFFYKFYLSVLKQFTPDAITHQLSSAIEVYDKPVSKSSQGFQSTSQKSNSDTIGQPLMHLSAEKQVTGEAKYIDDLPHYENELYAGLVLSERAHAEFTLDTQTLDGINDEVYIVTADDVPGSNDGIGVFQDEQVFRKGTVTSVGQIIAIVLAGNKSLAQRYAKMIKVNYTELTPVLTIQDAIKQKQFHPENNPIHRRLSCGDVQSALSCSELTVEGTMRTGGQEHFYLETMVCIAIPKGEDGAMEIIASTQGPLETQLWAAKALGVDGNKVVAKVKRIGGGFGGKQTRCPPLTTAVAVAASKVGRPVRIMLDRNEDMVFSGQRQPFLGNYKAGFTKEGKLTALELQLYANGGYSTDSSIGVMEKALTNFTNVYYVPNALVQGSVCRTNLPSNTACRGLSSPQGMIMMESILDKIAYTLHKDPVVVRELNLIKDGQQTIYGFTMEDCHMEECWKTLLETSCYYERRKQIDEFNKENQWIKRGLAIIPTKYGIGFGLKLLNQGGALVLVYKDGSVLVSHGGVELGQGLHTKMIQVCSRILDIPMSKIHLDDCASDKIANPTITGASVSTDLYGMAVKNACDQINERLKPYKENDPHGGWDKWVVSAYFDRVNLSAQGFYKTPDIGMDWETGKGRPYNYYCYGAGCSEVEIDTLTGDFRVIRSDLLMDVGNSINPAIDIGQVEGAFTQGLGLFTMEECVFLKDGKMFTTGPGTYKIPTANDIPIELNVALMDRTPNPRAIFNSKAVGEPPLFLAGSVFFAIKDAIRASRDERGHSLVFDLQAPATCERIRLACEDQFTSIADQEIKKKHGDKDINKINAGTFYLNNFLILYDT